MNDVKTTIAEANELLEAAAGVAATDPAAATASLKQALDLFMEAAGSDETRELALKVSRPINLVLVGRVALSEDVLIQITEAAADLAAALTPTAARRICEHLCDTAGACSQVAGVRLVEIDEVRCTVHLDEACTAQPLSAAA